MRLFVVFCVVFLSGCFVFPRNGMLPFPRRMEIYRASDTLPEKRSTYTPLQEIKTLWYHQRREGYTRDRARRERSKGYTADVRCRRHHSYVVDLALIQEASIIRGGTDIIDVQYGGYYRRGGRRRQLVCWAKGVVVRRGSDPPPTPSGLIKVRQCHRGRCGRWTRW